MTRALVTGGAGFIGSAIARKLLERGSEVVILDNLLTGFKENIPAEAEFIEGDLRDRQAVEAACRGVDVVFHQAALRSVPRSVDDPVLTTECNVLGTLGLLEAAERAKVRRVVYASSSSVYGDRREGLNREDMTPNPLSPYAASKLGAEYYCRVWTQLKGLSTVSLRYFNVFGPGQHAESRYAAIFPAFIAALNKGEAPELHWDGEQSRDFTYIDDVVDANLCAAAAGADADGEIFNIGGGGAKTVNEVYRAVSEVLGVNIEPRRLPQRAGDVRHTRADITKAGTILAWHPKAGWRFAVRSTVNWLATP